MASSERAAEVGDRSFPLVQHRTEAGARGVTVNDEVPREVWQVEDRCSREGCFELVKGRSRRVGPLETGLAQQLR